MSQALERVLQGQEDNHILPFFWQHGEDTETLRKYMHVIHDANIGAVCVESRPHPDFCGPKWWEDMDAIIGEAKELGMKVWILDDAHFPTGYANGAAADADPSLCRQSLTVQYVPVENGSAQIALADYQQAGPWAPSFIEGHIIDPSKFRVFEDDQLVSVTAMKEGGNIAQLIDLTDTAENGVIHFTAPDEGSWKIAVTHLTRNRGPHRNYINMMDKASCRLLIDAVYEPHFAHYGEEFGKTIEGFFSDEPEIGNGHLYEYDKKIGQFDDEAWSDAVGARLQAKWGADYRRFLPLIWEQDFDPDLQAMVRCDYMDAVTLEVKECFSFQVGDWCRAHGVKYIGHLIEDNHQHSRTGSSLGHYFRGLAGQDWAGVDDIGGQVMPQGEHIGPGDFMNPTRDGEFWHYTLGKLAGSMAAIDPLKHGDAMCEIFGNYGWSEGVRLEKYLADHLMVRGINNYVPHAFTAKAYPDPDCPPHFYAHGHNPQYRHFGALMKYMNRVCTLISGGRAVIPAAILYNAEADWAGEFMYLQKPAIQLYDHQIDYHFIPADVFMDAEREAAADPARVGLGSYDAACGKVLRVGGQTYQTLIVPYMQYIPQAAAAAAIELAKAGCPVFFIKALPEATIEGGHADPVLTALSEAVKVVPVEELAGALAEAGICDACIEPADNRIRIYHYQNGRDFYMIVNEGTQTYHGAIRIGGDHGAAWYDAWSNTAAAGDQFGEVTGDENGTAFPLMLEPSKSLFLIVDAAAEELADIEEDEAADALVPAAFAAPQADAADFSEGWMRSICKPLDYPDFAGAKLVNLPDALGEEEPKFSGLVRYEKQLTLDTVPASVVLSISDAYEGVEVFVNGESLGIQVVPGYRYELAPYLKEGANEIRIEVATTLEREAWDFPSRFAMPGMEKPPVTTPSGINGKVCLQFKTMEVSE
ncbi:MAG: hypothetical protein J6M46_09370 [Lachnospiraceae bacterium]|nr:hypothetical protein [Lachnospiraceae bacterium]